VFIVICHYLLNNKGSSKVATLLHKGWAQTNLIPRDIVTCWNSTCDLLEFMVRYHKPISKITCDEKLGQLHKYHLSAEEWSVIEELVTVLQVSIPVVIMSYA